MFSTVGGWTFVGAPIVLGAILLWRFPDSRQFRWRSLVVYVVVMSLLIFAALAVVGWIASARVIASEIAVVLWFTISWRIGWEIWSRSVNALGRRWVRWARMRRRQSRPVPMVIRLIPAGRAMLTASVFVVGFLCTVVTHRCKLADGQDPMGVFTIPFEHVRIPTSDGLMLDGWFVPDRIGLRTADRTIVICHGAGANKGNFIWFLAPLVHQGYNVLFFDFRAHGGSDGRTTTYGIREKLDVLGAVEWLKRERPEHSRRIVGLGSSQGAFALALAAGEDARIDAVVLDSPFVSPRELVHDRTACVPIIGPLLGDYLLAVVSIETGTSFFAPSAEEAVRAMGGRPILVIHGEEDFVMPCSHSQRLYDAATGPREIWFGPGPHSNIVTAAPHDYGRRVLEFLERSLGQSR